MIRTATFPFTNLKEQKQKVPINEISSLFEIVLSSVPEGSILGLILFNIFYNDLLLRLKISDPHNFTEYNTIAEACNNFTSLCQILEKESKSTIDCFKYNGIISNPGKFQAMILSKDATDVPHKLRIYNNKVETTKSVKLLRVETDYQINSMNMYLSYLPKAAMQLKALYRLQRFMRKTEKNAIINNFIYSSFSFAHSSGIFFSFQSSKKVDNIQKRCLGPV